MKDKIMAGGWKFLLVLIFVSAGGAAFGEGIVYKELNIMGGYSDRDKWVGKRGMDLKNSVGFEYYRGFSDSYGDFLAVDLQVRAAYDSTEDAEDAAGIEIHNAWLRYKLGLGESITLGHFDPEFGLEPVLDTHGTLLQTLAEKNIGFKSDWGAKYKGLLGDYDCAFAAQLGSGMGIRRKDGSFLLTGRLSRVWKQDVKYGISFLYGRTLESMQSWTIPAAELMSGETTLKKRVGLDVICPLGPFEFKGEIAAGKNENDTVGGALAQIDYAIPQKQEIVLQLQTFYWSNDWNEKSKRDFTVSPVVEYKLNSKTTLRLGYFYDFYASGSDEDRMILLQLYYYGR